MRLHIREDNPDYSSLECTYITWKMLQMPITHLFIASNKWESVFVELDESIPQGSLKHLNMLTNNITVKLPESTSRTTMTQLIELYPSLTGKIRKAFMTNRDVKEVLGGCVVQ